SAAASATTQAPAPEGHGDHTSTPSEAPETSATAPEQPQAAPETTPQSAPASDKDKAFLAELKKQGVTPSRDDTALQIANYVCVAVKSKYPDDQLVSMVNAMAGSDAQATGKNLSEAELATAGRAYISAAKSTYCR
ncbi:MAG: DUF732 domain-containing protein, partial [Mycobacteriaceae bacterium]|nr:DUF732 domain-containing protein [Mycobacteriaceae bacterium]